MLGEALQLVEFLNGAKQRFVIPVFQRNYDWKIKHCEQLFNDLVKVIRRQRTSHFFGSIVSISPGGHSKEFQIIDGQQRLTTTTLLLLAMYNLLNEGKIEPEDETLKEKIFEQYLVDPYALKKYPIEKYVKLRPIKKDRDALYKLFDDQAEPVKDSNITINYNYFYNRIQQAEIIIDELFFAVESLEIINITLDQDEDPQLVFESLNSTGLALSESDKVRNYLLMGLKPQEQEEYYSKYWEKIENCAVDNLDNFIRDYLSVKQSSIPSKKEIYFDFKSYVEGMESKPSVESLLCDLLKYARFYKTLLGNDHTNNGDSRLKSCIRRLNRLETTVARPFFLEVLRLNDENKLSKEETFQIFRLTENYIFRRLICEIPTNALNKIFLGLHNEIVHFDDNMDQYLEKFKYALLDKREHGKFPTDEEFSQTFVTKQIYQMTYKNKTYIFERLENFDTNEDKDVYRHIDDKSYSIEHIMPQHLTSKWVKDLGQEYTTIHRTWLHRIANLTLTAYNSQYGNNSFEEKRDSKNGYKTSGIRMNQQIAQKVRWGEEELEERSEYFANLALAIWERPHTNYVPSKKELEYCTLQDNVDLTGKDVSKFVYKQMEQPVRSWQETYENVLRQLHSENKSVLYKLSQGMKESDKLAKYFSNKGESLYDPLEIDAELYIERRISPTMKRNILRQLFKLFGIDAKELIFYFRGVDTEDFGSFTERRALRQAFWAHTIPILRKYTQNSGAFNKVYKSSENWLNGAIGIRHFYLTPIANYDQARASLSFVSNDKTKNKLAFDALYKHKDEIEKELGVALVWERNDNAKSSKIYYVLNDVSITKREDWDKMAEFQGIWCAKFYDKIVVPYLKPIFSQR